MGERRPDPGRHREPRPDRITRADRLRRGAYRLRGRALCLAGRHLWVQRTHPDVSGPRAVYRLCRRCGRERNEYDPPAWTTVAE